MARAHEQRGERDGQDQPQHPDMAELGIAHDRRNDVPGQGLAERQVAHRRGLQREPQSARQQATDDPPPRHGAAEAIEFVPSAGVPGAGITIGGAGDENEEAESAEQHHHGRVVRGVGGNDDDAIHERP
jgi:hypothetical protein